MNRGKHFIHEHPWTATSWATEPMKSLLDDARTILVRADQCAFGLKTPSDEVKGEFGYAKKPTGFLTRGNKLADALRRRCPKDHKHIHLMSGRAANAAIYTDELVEAICSGIIEQKKEDWSSKVRTGKLNGMQLRSVLSSIMSDFGKDYVSTVVRRGDVSVPIGDWPSNWIDAMRWG